MLIPTEYINLLLPAEANTNDFWVMKSDSLYNHFKASENSVYPVGYKMVTNFVNGIAHVAPVDMILLDTSINKSQIHIPNTDQSTIASSKLEEYRDSFGYLLRNDGVTLMNKPVSTLYKDAVVKNIEALGNKVLTETEKKQILLNVTAENRSYNLDAVISEDEWNY